MGNKGMKYSDEQKAQMREKQRLTGIAKYGSEEAWRAKLAENGLKAKRTGQGHFYQLYNSDPQKLKQLSRDAANKRWSNEKAKNDSAA